MVLDSHNSEGKSREFVIDFPVWTKLISAPKWRRLSLEQQAQDTAASSFLLLEPQMQREGHETGLKPSLAQGGAKVENSEVQDF